MILWIVRNYMIGMLPNGGSIVDIGESAFERGKSKILLRYKPNKQQEFIQQVELVVDSEAHEKYVAKRLVAALKEQENCNG